MALIIVGAVLIVIGALILPLLARHQHKKARTFSEVPRYDCVQVAEHGELAPGMRVAVSGRAVAGPGGALTAPASNRPCVWYRLVVSERVRETRRDSDGKRTTRETERVISEERSPDAIVLRDGTGQVLIEPADARVDRATETIDRLDAPPAAGVSTISIGPVTVNLGNGDGVIGIRRREEIIALDEDLYVLGGAYNRGGEGVIRKPREGMYVISTRTAQELAAGARTGARWFTGFAGGLTIVGIVLVVLGIIL